MTGSEATLFRGFLVGNPASFYKGADDQGRPVGQWSLTASLSQSVNHSDLQDQRLIRSGIHGRCLEA